MTCNIFVILKVYPGWGLTGIAGGLFFTVTQKGGG